MPRFFCEYISGESHIIDGDDATHIIKSLRMKPLEKLMLCDTYGYDYECIIRQIKDNTVVVDILNKHKSLSEPTINVTLYQGIPKGSKLELICQKSVELGVTKIVPVLMDRSISKLENKKKIDRLQKISNSAAKQSGRGIIPKITEVMSFTDAVNDANIADKSIFFYENGGDRTGDAIDSTDKSFAIFIGPEGGFSLDEVEAMRNNNIKPVSLGRRILRTETAPITALSIIMYLTGNL